MDELVKRGTGHYGISELPGGEGDSERFLRICCVDIRDLPKLKQETNTPFLQQWEQICRQAQRLGFNSILINMPDWIGTVFQKNSAFDEKQMERTGDVSEWMSCSALASLCDTHGLRFFLDFRPELNALGGRGSDAESMDFWILTLSTLNRSGVHGVRCAAPMFFSTGQWRELIARTQLQADAFQFLVWTPGLSAEDVDALTEAGFDACFSSLPWWDGRASWLMDERDRLKAIAPVAAPVADIDALMLGTSPMTYTDHARERTLCRLRAAAVLGQGLAFPMALAHEVGPEVVIEMNRLSRTMDAEHSYIADVLSGPLSAATVLRRGRVVLAINPSPVSKVQIHWLALLGRLPDGYTFDVQDMEDMAFEIKPESSRILFLAPVDAANKARRQHQNTTTFTRLSVQKALRAPRIAIENVLPSVEGGAFASRATVGQLIEVEATVFSDGHARVTAQLLWREAEAAHWHEVPMIALGNDRWQARFRPVLPGAHCYTIRAWREGSFETTCPVSYPLWVERRRAAFASWYELFPRSCGAAPEMHGTLMDVIQRLPAIQKMGFDVLYFPPIHPIGRKNRKGKNNALSASPDDPGSPYAIGAPEGGHDAVHPQLGTLEDFKRLVQCAADHGMEIALDFAVQCSPDHPWLVKHPTWFAWREDGTVQYAENPPKKYEDIVNPDFYSEQASVRERAALWRQLRDVVNFWIAQGVRIFRVDNPHTKPLPFWQWLISDVHARHPDVIFLSEAFTKPAMMYRLAKIGFSQSYSYFTWRNTKQELTDYLSELNQHPIRGFFRPNFFVNTPDINPYYLQTSGRPGFLIRAVLATTMSGLWGMYSGFELCEGEPMPGREEYLNSEKYQLRWRDWDAPENITFEITRLNRIRRAHPALHTHLGIRFHRIDSEHLIFYSKTSPEGDDIVLVVVNLDPHSPHSATLELPLWEWGMSDDARVELEDLFDGRRFSLTGKYHFVEMTSQTPFLVWGRVPS
jgi:starch synthase (maltosyl-transferring)|tara:strand:- start:32945 stop:35875 length:2931 start_codon:yes stop_codon:yes gene_type:complete